MPRPLLRPARKPSPHQPSIPSQRSLARRAVIEPRTHAWRHRGVAALAIGVLGFGTAASVVLVGNAERPVAGTVPTAVEKPAVERSIAAGVPRPKAFVRKSTPTGSTGSTGSTATRTDGTDGRPTRDSVRVAPPAELLSSVTRSARARSAELAKQTASTRKRAAKLAEKRAKKRAEERERRQEMLGDGQATLPVPGARTAAGFGATGAWARYHTGIDFSAGSGTAIRAPRAGVVTTAGSGRAGGWAGTYVTIEHSDGTTSLYAHMSGVEVSVGEEVDAGRVIGRVGQTGRAFGPHLHFEIYPAGVEPSDVYRAVDPWPWLRDLGL